MEKSSKKVALTLLGTGSLILVGSAFLFQGCEGTEDGESWAEDGQGTGQHVAGQANGTTHHGGGFFFIPRLFGGGFGGGGGRATVAPAPSARGGFGATGSVGVGS